MKPIVKTTVKPAGKAPTLDVRPTLDYPKQAERIAQGHYGMRVTSPDADEVDVSINQGPWLSCRASVGHWWYDWRNFDAGEHEVIARARAKGGRWLVSTPHEFFVD
jgi:hypothetical protein